MISVLIPVLNFDLRQLVSDLNSQVKNISPTAEIVVYNDGSNTAFTLLFEELDKFPTLRILNSSSNKGIIAARKILAREAKNDWLLFIDADAQLTDQNFLAKYINNISASDQILIGGAAYAIQKPPCNKVLHWKYGIERELPSGGFKTINFMIPKNIFLEIPFPETSGYGHEDTWMGIYFEQKRISIKKINNPVLHTGLEDNTRFLEKSILALDNIKLLLSFCDKETLKKHIRIYRVSERVRALSLAWMVILITRLFLSSIKKNLLSCNPSLKVFDLYRLGELLKGKI